MFDISEKFFQVEFTEDIETWGYNKQRKQMHLVLTVPRNVQIVVTGKCYNRAAFIFDFLRACVFSNTK